MGVLRIGSLESAAGSRLPPILSCYHRQHPGVVVKLVTGTTGALLQRVAQFEIEAAFVSEPFTPNGLSKMKAFEEELVLITGRGVRPVRRAEDLAGMSMVAFATGCSYRRRLEDGLGASGLLPARTLELASYQAMIACVAAGTGFAVVPRSLLVSLKAADEVQQHELPAKVRRNQTHLVWKGAPSSALLRLQEMLDVQRIARGPHRPHAAIA